MDRFNSIKQEQSKKSREKVIKMMSDLEKFVQDCVSCIFEWEKLDKCEIKFYQQIAGRLVNVTVELESALEEINSIIEKLDKITQQSESALVENFPRNKCTPIQQDKQHTLSKQLKQQIQIAILPKSTTLFFPSPITSQFSINFQPNHTSQVSTLSDLQSLATANDLLYKEYSEQLAKYQHDKLSLNHENQIILNQWLENHSHNQASNQNLYNMTKTLIYELSKYESVTQHINGIESIQHSKIIHQLKSTLIHHDDQQTKWFKNVTKSYLLDMAELLQNHSETQFLEYCHQNQCQDPDVMY